MNSEKELIDDAVIDIGHIALSGLPPHTGFVYWAPDVRHVLTNLVEEVKKRSKNVAKPCHRKDVTLPRIS